MQGNAQQLELQQQKQQKRQQQEQAREAKRHRRAEKDPAKAAQRAVAMEIQAAAKAGDAAAALNAYDRAQQDGKARQDLGHIW